MRATTTLAALAAGAGLWFTVAGAGADSEDPFAGPTADSGPRNQILGDWRQGREARYRFTLRRGRVSGHARRSFDLRGCRIRRGTVAFRGYRFVRREPAADLWEGRAAVPGQSCRIRYVPSSILVTSDLRMRERSRADGRPRVQRFTRIRPPVRATDPVLGTWERNDVGVVVEIRDRAYVGRAREDFLIGNSCRIPAGTVVWHFRPSAPERYEGVAQTFLPPPTCDPGVPVRSRWLLEPGGATLVREATDGSRVEYERAG